MVKQFKGAISQIPSLYNMFFNKKKSVATPLLTSFNAEPLSYKYTQSHFYHPNRPTL